MLEISYLNTEPSKCIIHILFSRLYASSVCIYLRFMLNNDLVHLLFILNLLPNKEFENEKILYCPNWPQITELSITTAISLHWRHNDHDGVSNHQPHGCLLNRLFGRRSKKTSQLRVTGLCAVNSPGPVNSPHKWPVTWKMFPFDDVIMWRCYKPTDQWHCSFHFKDALALVKRLAVPSASDHSYNTGPGRGWFHLHEVK